MKGILLMSASVAALLPFTAAAQATAPADRRPAPNAAPADPVDGADIVVTASKRAERLQDVPAAITALGGQQLDTLGVRSFKEYQSLVPGLSQRDQGAPGLGNVVIRGLTTGAVDLRTTTAFYLDDAQFTANGFITLSSYVTPDPELGDVERIEVLKGPQGTLYGASSLGGLVRVISVKPDATRFSGNARGEVNVVDGGGTGGMARGSINIPLVSDKLAIRASGIYRKLPGYADNVGTGVRNANDGEVYGGRVALRYTPTSDLAIDVFGIIQDINTNGYAFQDNVTDTLRPVYGERKYSSFFRDGTDSKYRLASGTISYDLGQVTLTGSTSYVTYDVRQRQDQSPTYVPLVAAILPPNSGIAGFSTPTSDKWTSEIRLTSKRIGPVEFILGGYYTQENTVYSAYFETRNRATNQPLPAPFANFATTSTVGDYKEWAGFGDLTVYLADSLDVTGGIRYAHNRQVIRGTQSGLIFGGGPPTGYTSPFSDDVTTYLGTVRYRPSRNVSLFLRAASGYRPGGPQTQILTALPPGAQTSIRPDTVWNYEGGIRGNFLDGRLNLSASVYRIDWKDVQLNTLYGGVVLQGNGGKARVNGFEIEATARPSSMLTVSANIGYTDAKLTSIDPNAAASLGAAAGDQLPLTPDWTAAVIADQRFALGGSTEGSIGATLRFQSDMPTSFSVNTLNPNIKLPDQTTLDLRASVKFGRFSIQGRVDNVLNALNYSYANTNRLVSFIPVPTIATVNRPRTFSLGVGVNF